MARPPSVIVLMPIPRGFNKKAGQCNGERKRERSRVGRREYPQAARTAPESLSTAPMKHRRVQRLQENSQSTLTGRTPPATAPLSAASSPMSSRACRMPAETFTVSAPNCLTTRQLTTSPLRRWAIPRRTAGCLLHISNITDQDWCPALHRYYCAPQIFDAGGRDPRPGWWTQLSLRLRIRQRH